MKRNTLQFILILLLCLTSVIIEAANVKVGVLLPLTEKSGRGQTMVEFYRGLLMAVEQMKTEGNSVDVYAWDCGNSETELQTLLREPAMTTLDVVFGPVDAVQVPSLSDFCRKHRIRMVVPFNTPCTQVYSNPNIYMVGVSQELLYPHITNLITDNLKGANFIFFHTGETDSRGTSFTEHLHQVLSLRNMSTANLALGADEFAYDRAFNQFRTNVVIPDSRSQASLTKMIAGIKAYQEKFPQYKVVLFGYPEWLTYVNTMLKDFYQYDTRVFSSYYRNPLSGRVAKFELNYKQNYGINSRESFPRAEMLGYDLAYYFMHGLAVLGDNFDDQQGTLEQKPLQHTFSFERTNEHGGFVNLNVQFVHYRSDNTIQIVR